jgi:hypothetical protein
MTPRARIVAALERLARLALAVARDLPADVHPAAAAGAVRLVGRAVTALDAVHHAARRGEP